MTLRNTLNKLRIESAFLYLMKDNCKAYSYNCTSKILNTF